MSQNSNLEHKYAEFRKIPSLQFLYEVNGDGTVIRNVKSKRHLTIRADYHHSESGYKATFVNIKGKVHRVMVHKVVAECWLGTAPDELPEVDHINRDSQDNRFDNLRYVSHSGQMKNRVLSDRIVENAKANCAAWNKRVSVPVIINGERYDSIYAAARHMAEKYNTTVEHMRGKLKARRSSIYGDSVQYLCAETRHGDHGRNKAPGKE